MKKIQFFALVLTTISLSFVFSCKKDDNGGGGTPATNVLCDGKGTNSYLPLAMNNSWSYSSGSNVYSITAVDTIDMGGEKYYEMSSNLGGTSYFRQGSNGDILVYNQSTSTVYVYVPANPTVNQTWAYPLEYADTRKVTSISATVTTPSCTYTGCVEIKTYDSSNALVHTYYYKKGLGMISTDVIWGGVIVTTLDGVVLN